MMSKRNVILGVVILVLILVIGYFVIFYNKNDDYSVVYLTTGEVYVGKLTTFPSLELRDAYILQVIKDTVDPTKNNFQLNPINEALWAPKELHLIEKNVVFYGPILPTSKIAQTLVSQKK